MTSNRLQPFVAPADQSLRNAQIAATSPRLLWLTSGLLFLAPAINLIGRGGTGYCFFALLTLALYFVMRDRRESNSQDYLLPLRRYGWYTAAMLVLLIEVTVQQAVLQYWMPRQFDAISRFALSLPVFLYLRNLPSRYLRAIGWGCAVGAILVAVLALAMQPAGGWTADSRLNNSFTNAIPFGDTALLLGFLSVFTLGWDRIHDRRVWGIKLLALFCGCYASYLSGTRGGWIVVPIFVLLLGFQYRWFSNRKRLIVSVMAIALMSFAILSNERVQLRIEAISSDVQLMHQGVGQTSVGIRVQLWHAAVKLFAQHPIYGVGKGHLTEALGDLAQRGEASAGIVNERAHSDFFSTLAEEGAVGVAALAIFYIGLSLYFVRNCRADDPTIRAAAFAGLAVSLSTILYGLTIDVLVPNMVTVLIALLSATFLAAIDARRRELAVA